MNVLGRLALLFVVVPVVELILLIRLGQAVGLGPTLGLVLLTGLTGAAMARREGLRVLFRVQGELASGKLPGRALLDGIAVLLGGAFLLTPGVLTDLAGLALLFPPTRRLVQRWVLRRLERSIADGSIQVVTMGPGGFGWSSTGEPWGGRSGEEPSREPRLDPAKGIVIEAED